jgi:hypothetical protein
MMQLFPVGASVTGYVQPVEESVMLPFFNHEQARKSAVHFGLFVLVAAFTVAVSYLTAPNAPTAPAVQIESHDGLPGVELSKKYNLSQKELTGSPNLLYLAATHRLGDILAPPVYPVPSAVAWSLDGKKLVALTGSVLDVWNAGGNGVKVIVTRFGLGGNSLEFLNDDEVLVPGSRPAPPDDHYWGMTLWSTKTGSLAKGIPSQYPDDNFLYNTYTLSPDKSLLAAIAQGGSGFAKPGPAQEFGEHPVPIYSTKTWEIVQRIPVVWPWSVAFSPDGKQIAFGTSTGKIILYDTTTWQVARTIKTCDSATQVHTIAYSPDGQFIAAGLVATIQAARYKFFVSRMQRWLEVIGNITQVTHGKYCGTRAANSSFLRHMIKRSAFGIRISPMMWAKSFVTSTPCA